MPLLPNAENAEIPIEKLKDYCLNENHPKGKHKARVFKATFGYTADDAEQLKDLIQEEVLKNEASEKGETDFGKRYEVDFEHQNEKGEGNITTGWLIENQKENPRLTSCYVNTDKKKK